MGPSQVKGNLDLLLLGVLRNGALHGYAVIAGLRDRSSGSFDLPEGTVYPALHKLERAGLVASRWEDSSGRRRRVYELTPDGHRALSREHSQWLAFVRNVNAVLAVPVT
ncbi:MAG: helix-turn-helix transcriptional regulator [Acidobacteriota bacterium]|nr:helix-turn-helix transcriptional regulator [Acidobacteriota bacterium]